MRSIEEVVAFLKKRIADLRTGNLADIQIAQELEWIVESIEKDSAKVRK